MSGAVDPHFDMFIAGQQVDATGTEPRVLLNPADNRPLTKVASGTGDDARRAMEAAEQAFRSSRWAGDDGAQRVRALWKLGKLLEERAEEFALLETLNVGKTIKESRFDVAYVVRSLEYFAGLADKVEGETIGVPGPRLDYTLREPLGVTVHISPWNYPLLLAARSVVPALAAGNAVVLKPASLTPLTALKFAQLGKEAGIPDGIFNVVPGAGTEVGEALVQDRRCASVTFTGSGDVGRRIAELAAARFIPTTLELGGKSPVVVFPDADLDRASKGIAFGIFGNTGQMCWAGSRLIVHESVAADLVGKVAAIAKAYKLGPGIEPTSDLGPLVSADQLDRVTSFIDDAKAAGSTLVTGGTRPTSAPLSAGNFVEPTILSDVPRDHRIVRDEVFGPVLSVLTFKSAEEAVPLANDTRYGLYAAVWTKDIATAHTTARQMDAGAVMINESPNSYPQTPFSGFKESGLGFEQSREAVTAFTRRKNVLVNLGMSRPKKP